MILGIGTDIVAVERFAPWVTYPHSRLYRVFSEQEIRDCRDANGALVPEKLAVRFAAKEAFYKALSSALVTLGTTFEPFSLLAVCRFVSVCYGPHGVPVLKIEWAALEALARVDLQGLSPHLSLSHEKTSALAFVLVIGA